jgi:hypothetical protein
MDKEMFGKILIVISIIGLIFTISISSFTLVSINNTYEKSIPLFDKIDLIKNHVDTFDENLDEFNLYLKDIDTIEYKQKLANMRSFIGTLNSIGLGSLVSGLNEDIDRFEGIVGNLEELKLNLESAKSSFSEIKSSLTEYDTVKESILSFVRTLRLFVLGMMAYSIIINGILLYVGYYLLKSKE